MYNNSPVFSILKICERVILGKMTNHCRESRLFQKKQQSNPQMATLNNNIVSA